MSGMIELLLVLLPIILPVLSGLLVMVIPISHTITITIVPLVASLHLFSTIFLWIFPTGTNLLSPYLAVTPEGRVVLLIISLVFWAVSLRIKQEKKISSPRSFLIFLFLFIASMSLVALADHLILFWAAIEFTTLVSAPLILIHLTKHSLEATWKYIILCSIGIALALIGVFLIVISFYKVKPSLTISFSHLALAFQIHRWGEVTIDTMWTRVAFIFILIGLGTKMGLAPMHSWLPDAYSESPTPVSALMSGTLVNCAFLGILKTHQLLINAGVGYYSSRLLIIFGLMSMAVASIFILRQTDSKRLLAYSSIENMGVICVGTGIGGVAIYGVILHLLHHALLKSSLFMSIGNLVVAYKSKLIKDMGRGVQYLPRSSGLLILGMLALIGFPPFGIFFSKLWIILGASAAHAWWVLAIFFLLLLLSAVGLMFNLIKIVFGGKRDLVNNINYTELKNGQMEIKERLPIFPQLFLILVSLYLTICPPAKLMEAIKEIVSVMK